MPLEETLGALAKARREGLAKNIGVSNFTVALIDEAVAKCSEPLFTNQIEYHAYIRQDKVIDACNKYGLIVTCHVPLARGAILEDPVICNVAESTIVRQADLCFLTRAGPEIGVASTKAFTTQVIVLILLALKVGKLKGNITLTEYHQIINEIDLIPDKVRKVLKTNSQIELIAQQFKDAKNFLYLGRGYNFPVALEGALKLKEISYIHAEGYPAAEMKHGPIALIDEDMPIVVIATRKGNYEKVLSNIQEVKARGGRLISIVTEGDVAVKELSDYCIEIPKCFNELTPLLTNIPLQLLSYHIALLRGCNVDQPRNLAKSVTVE